MLPLVGGSDVEDRSRAMVGFVNWRYIIQKKSKIAEAREK
jgi:hypothetical protein